MSNHDLKKFKSCQLDDCPSPQVKHPVGDYIENKNGVITCLFCVARLKSIKKEIPWKPKPIKKTLAIEEQRIPPHGYITQKFSNLDTADRIPANLEKKHQIEETDIWKIILSTVNSKFGGQPTGSLKSFTIIPQNNHPRVIETDRNIFLVRLAHSKSEQVYSNYLNMIANIKPFSRVFALKLTDFPSRVKFWAQHHLLNGNIDFDLIDDLIILFVEPTGVLLPIDQLINNPPPLSFLETISYELGHWMYGNWLLGNKNALKLIINSQRSLNQISFLPLASFESGIPFDSELLHKYLLKFTTSYPFLLDIECKEKFNNGAADGKLRLQEKFKDQAIQEEAIRLVNQIKNFTKDLKSWPDLIY